MQKRIDAFVKLGNFLSQFSTAGITKNEAIEFNDLFFDGFKHQIKLAEESNSWFTKDNILYALESWSIALSKSNLAFWLDKITINNSRKKVAIIMAGNIPLVGFHDFLSVLISGNKALVKLSSNDKTFLPLITKYLEHVESNFKGKIYFTEGKLEDCFTKTA